MKRLAILLAIFPFLTGCIFSVATEDQVYSRADFVKIGDTEWRAATSIFGNPDKGRSSKVSDKGTVTIIENDFGLIESREYKEGKLTGGMAIELDGSYTLLLRTSQPDKPEESCKFGVVRAAEDLFILPSIGQCDGEFANYVAAATDKPDTNGFTMLSFDSDEAERKKTEALAMVHGLGIATTGSSIFVFGDIEPEVFSQFIFDARSAGLLR